MGEQQTSRQLLSIVYNAATVVRAAAAAVAVAATLFTSRQSLVAAVGHVRQEQRKLQDCLHISGRRMNTRTQHTEYISHRRSKLKHAQQGKM